MRRLDRYVAPNANVALVTTTIRIAVLAARRAARDAAGILCGLAVTLGSGGAALHAQVGGQAVLTGVVRDTSGAVLPGVLVEASSDALIERVRTTTTDGSGHYRITNLPAGVFTVRFSLSGFNTVAREGIRLEGAFTANIDADLRIGALEETVTVVGGSPVVDVQSARQAVVVEGDVFRELPTSRSVNQLLSLVPGMVGGSGVCTGGLCGYTLNAYSAHGGNATEGRLNVDGLSAGSAIGGAGVGAFVVDVGTAQELAISVSGHLGESEVGGPVINVVPRAGGNRPSGSYFTSYTRTGLFDTNNANHPQIAVVNSLDNDHDVSGSFGGPVRRDRVWYFLQARHQGRTSNVPNGYRNVNEGVFGANYVPDLTAPVQQVNTARNVSLRLTLQATARNRLAVFWNEQDWCTNCRGSGNDNVSSEAATTSANGPHRVQQVTWINPFTNRVLFEAGFSALNSKWGIWPHFDEPFYRGIPRIVETGSGAHLGNITSGAQTSWDADSGNYNGRASATAVLGGHSLKAGYQGSWLANWQTMDVNDERLHYTYVTPQGGGTPIPSSVTMWARPYTTDERTTFAAFYMQDQWTAGRVTLQGAWRYDHAWSSFPEQAHAPSRFVRGDGYTFPKTDGVSFHDITPRWGATWDVFGDGKTAIKYHMGKYLQPATVANIYNATNPMRRVPESVSRSWNDLNGNRHVDCDFFNPANHTRPGGDQCGASGAINQFGLDPRLTGVGFTTTQCGSTDPGAPDAVLDYCAALDRNVLSGWGVRQYDWQIGLGVQREVLPRVSLEVTYNRRWYGNHLLTDNLNLGCTRLDEACLASNASFSNPSYDFLSITAPQDPRLPGGGGYLVEGLTDINPDALGRPVQNAVTITSDETRYWHGVDTSLSVRGVRGFRFQVGTSTGRQVTDTCQTLVDNPQNPFTECRNAQAWRTDVRGFVAYTLPKIDVLVSSVVQYRPGPEVDANYTVNCSARLGCTDVQWHPNARDRTVFSGLAGTKTVDLVRPNSWFADGTRHIDMKIAKVFRYRGTRINVGMDIYNVLNDDGVTAYNWTYNPNQPGGNPWFTPTDLVSPRLARFQVAFDF